MKRKWRQPSRQVRRWGGLDRPSGRSTTGTSVMRMPFKEALMTISLANSMPVARRRIRS